MRFYFDLTAGKSLFPLYYYCHSDILSFRIYPVIPGAFFCHSERVFSVIPSGSERILSVVVGLRIREYNSCGRHATFDPW